MSEEPKKHFYSAPNLQGMTSDQIDEWAKQLHRKMVSDLRRGEAEPIDEEPTEEPEAKA